MPRSRAEATATVATSQELLRSALHRSQRRNIWVARRRLWWRWSVYLLGKGLLYLGPPLLVAAAAAWWWQQSPPATGPRPSAPPAVVPASAPAVPVPPVPAASAPLQLRLDDDVVQASTRARHPRLPLQTAEAASAADAQE
jgi:hypothetical protein